MTGILESWSGIESFVEELKADESNDIEYLEENYLKSFLSLLGWDQDDYLIENKDGAYDFTLRDNGRPLFVKIKNILVNPVIPYFSYCRLIIPYFYKVIMVNFIFS